MVRTMGLQEDLIAALDAERVVAGEDERRRHGTDEGWHSPAAPDVVVYPRDTEEAAAVVRICRAHGVPIVPFGAGTSLEGHVAALSRRRLGRHDADERDPAPVGRGHGRDRPGRRHAPPARREAAPRGRVLLRRPGRGRDDRRDDRHRRLGDDLGALRHDARERHLAHGGHRRRRDRAHALAGAQVLRGL